MKEKQQEFFDIVARALLKQGKPSLDSSTWSCLFHGPDNTRCAAGWIIKEYPKLDNLAKLHNSTSYRSLVKFYGGQYMNEPLPEELRAPEMIDFIARLQAAHDYKPLSMPQTWMDSFKGLMREIAITYDLSPAALDEVKAP